MGGYYVPCRRVNMLRHAIIAVWILLALFPIGVANEEITIELATQSGVFGSDLATFVAGLPADNVLRFEIHHAAGRGSSVEVVNVQTATQNMFVHQHGREVSVLLNQDMRLPDTRARVVAIISDEPVVTRDQSIHIPGIDLSRTQFRVNNDESNNHFRTIKATIAGQPRPVDYRCSKNTGRWAHRQDGLQYLVWRSIDDYSSTWFTSDLPEAYRPINEFLATTTCEEGLQAIQNIVSGSDISSTPPQTSPGGTSTRPSSQERALPPPPPSIEEAPCGANRDFIVLCYDRHSLTPDTPASYRREIARWVAEEHGRAGSGYVIVTTQHESERGHSTSNLQGGETALQRAFVIQRELMTAQRQRLREGATEALPIAVTYTPYQEPERSPELHPIKIFVFSQESYERARTAGRLSGSLGGGVRLAIDAVVSDLTRWEESFMGSIQGITQERLESLVDQIEEHLLIEVVPMTSTTPWPMRDQELLHEMIREHPNNLLDNTVGGLRTDAILRPCRAYVLVDPEGAHLYQGDYCQLRYSRAAVTRADPGTEAVALLESALQMARREGRDARPNPELLLTRAYRYATSGEVVPDGEDQAELIVLWVLDEAEEKWGVDERRLATLGSSASVVLAAVEAFADTPDMEQALEDLGISEVAPVLPALERPQAEVALRIAAYLDNCGQMQQLIDRYRSQARSQRLIREAQRAYEDCLRARIDDCERLIGDNRYFDTIITFVNDGFSASDFENRVRSNMDFFFDLNRMGEVEDEFTIRTVTAPTRIVSATGNIRDRPSIDTRQIRIVQSACPADFTVVLADAYYRPLSRGDVFFMSPPACIDSDLCRDVYVSRAIAMQYFNLPVTENTLTGPLPPPGTYDFTPQLNREQAEFIHDKVRGFR